MILGSFIAFTDNTANLMGTPELISEYLTQKLSTRRMVAVFVGASVINWMLFTNKRGLDKAFMFLVAWMWAAYIDDELVMVEYFYVPDHWLPRLAVTLRPVTLILISWMAFEAHLRAENNDE